MMALEDQIAAIEGMSARERKAEWHRRIGTIAPPAFGSGLLARALAHELQTKAMGALSKADIKRIKTLGSGKGSTPATDLKPGTWLSRTWHGEVHQVVVLENGFEYRGALYTSLSEIARYITGTQWSGPRFFGLKSPRLGKLVVSANGQ
ncbi:DUF2924 domain-containing protein [Caenibius sp. WL]|uniref:DUF2924 domain-containing protein n=1 Tax=Caenibius sp. WL TaxID=2872646 RepID=UPI001C9A15AE|nr:DUF2924 domain-containing protein [Caenibius sp. WL]QZP09128.1 DUF2924 domain-containing protein [Caenibius sp. WL]